MVWVCYGNYFVNAGVMIKWHYTQGIWNITIVLQIYDIIRYPLNLRCVTDAMTRLVRGNGSPMGKAVDLKFVTSLVISRHMVGIFWSWICSSNSTVSITSRGQCQCRVMRPRENKDGWPFFRWNLKKGRPIFNGYPKGKFRGVSATDLYKLDIKRAFHIMYFVLIFLLESHGMG